MVRVSVIIPAYNAERFVARAIGSVIAQTEADLELIVVNNASTDATKAVVEACAVRHSQIRLLQSERNLGPGHARNLGIRMAQGKWIAFLDADDWYDPRRLELLLAAGEKYGVPLVSDNQLFIQDHDAHAWRLLVRGCSDAVQHLTADDLLQGDHLGRAGNLGLLKPVVRREFLANHRIRYDEEIGLCEDFYFLLQCLRFTPYLLFVPQPIYNYRIHKRNLSKLLTFAGYLAIRDMHQRHKDLFDPEEAPSTALLMEQRGQAIDRYIRYKRLTEPLKRGHYGAVLWQAFRDPGSTLLLVQGIVMRVSSRTADILWHRFPRRRSPN